MNEAEFQSWKLTREKGFGKYLLNHCLSYCLIIVLVNIGLNVLTNYYSYGSVILESVVLSVAIFIVSAGRWFQREKKFKEYLKIFNSK